MDRSDFQLVATFSQPRYEKVLMHKTWMNSIGEILYTHTHTYVIFDLVLIFFLVSDGQISEVRASVLVCVLRHH